MTVSLINKFTRRKIVDKNAADTQLNRVLSTLDLTLLGIGSTLGIGIYVLAGSVAKKDAGPAVVISFFVAAFASVLAGLCYAEFGARVPKAGSAYVYSYVCVGELIAFIVGWNLIMEYVIGVASVARGYSGYVDSLVEEQMSHAFKSFFSINVPFLSPYCDFFALGITLALTLILAFGVKESSLFNNIFTVLNLVVVVFVIIAGSIYAVPGYWALTREEIDKLLENSTSSKNMTVAETGVGGFAPFGFSGIMKGAATCFYGFVGFDCIATTGEEAKNPQRAIPLAIIFSLLFIFLAYFGISTVLTMMVPYFLQDAHAPLPQAFTSVGFGVGKWFVTIGALFGLSTSLLGAMFPMPRVIYAMATDGVLFKFLSKVHPRFQTPLIATLIAGAFGGVMAAIFELEALIDMMSIGTLTAYTLVAVCVLCLRYRKDVDGADDDGSHESAQTLTVGQFFTQFFNSNRLKIPTELTSSYTNWNVFIYCIMTCVFCAVAIFCEQRIINLEIGPLVALIVLGLTLCVLLFSLKLQPVSRVKLTFKVPLVPLLPGFSILANIYLIMKLSGATWVRFAVWMLIGFTFYFYCLFTGTTDKSYEAQLDEKQRRKYSKISVAEISTLQLSPVKHSNGKQDSSDILQHKGEANGNTFITKVQSFEDTKRVAQENGNHVLNKNINEQVQKSSSDGTKNETTALITGLSKDNETSQAAKDCIDSIMTLAHMHSVAQNSLNKTSNGDLQPILNSADDKAEIRKENARIQTSAVPVSASETVGNTTNPDKDLSSKLQSIHSQAQEVLKNLDPNSNGSKITLTTLVLESAPVTDINVEKSPSAESKHKNTSADTSHEVLGYDAINYLPSSYPVSFESNFKNSILPNEAGETNRGYVDTDSELATEEPIHSIVQSKSSPVKEDLIVFHDEHQDPIAESLLDTEMRDIEKTVAEVENVFKQVLSPDSEDNSSAPTAADKSSTNTGGSSSEETNKNVRNVEELVAKSDSDLKQIDNNMTSEADQGKTL